MIVRTMPTGLKKRRVIFVEDNIWNSITNEAFTKKVSVSEIVRKKLGGNLSKNENKKQQYS